MAAGRDSRDIACNVSTLARRHAVDSPPRPPDGSLHWRVGEAGSGVGRPKIKNSRRRRTTPTEDWDDNGWLLLEAI